MCYSFNVMSAGKFKGGLKRFKENHNLTDADITRLIADKTIMLIPCGQCLECRINYAKNWAARCEVESYYFENNHFITLTYDEEHVPCLNKITGEIYRGLRNPLDYYGRAKTYEALRLYKKDMTDFLKRLRDHAKRKGWIEDEELGIRYFYCGEYGSKTYRPHYHALIYGLKIPDLKYHYSAKGYMHFMSKEIETIWGNGLVDIGGVDYNSCQYVARYIVKKQKGKGKEEYYHEKGIPEEFIQMSLKPAIGYRYYQEHREEIYSLDKMYLKNGKKQKPPRQYDVWEDRECLAEEEGKDLAMLEEKYGPDAEAKTILRMQSFKMQEIKRERRKKAVDALFAALAKTTQSLSDYLQTKADRFEEQHKIAKEREMKLQT